MPESENVIKLRGHHIPIYELVVYGDKEDRDIVKAVNKHAGYGKAFTRYEFGIFKRIFEGGTNIRVKLVASEADSICEGCPKKDEQCFDSRISYDTDDIKEYGFELNRIYTSQEFNEGMIKKQGRGIERD